LVSKVFAFTSSYIADTAQLQTVKLLNFMQN
jgi:hypothetical protein